MGVVLSQDGRRGAGAGRQMSPRPALLTLVVVIGMSLAACGDDRGPQVTAVDLLRMAPRTERRPAGADFPIVEHTCAGTTLVGQAVPVPSRMTFTLTFPARARLVTAAALEAAGDAAAEFRIGVSDRRVYETVLTTRVPASACRAGWSDIVIDLSRYGGRQWSLFYRPDERTWELILGVTMQEGDAGRAIWGLPRIESDSRAAKAYLERRMP